MWPNFSPHPAKSPPFSREVFGSWGGFIFHFLIIIVRVVFLVFFNFFFLSTEAACNHNQFYSKHSNSITCLIEHPLGCACQ